MLINIISSNFIEKQEWYEYSFFFSEIFSFFLDIVNENDKVLLRNLRSEKAFN